MRRTCAIAAANVLTHDAADMIDAEKDDVIQDFLREGPIEPLEVRGSVGCAARDGDSLDVHDLVQPSVKVVTRASATAKKAVYRVRKSQAHSALVWLRTKVRQVWSPRGVLGTIQRR